MSFFPTGHGHFTFNPKEGIPQTSDALNETQYVQFIDSVNKEPQCDNANEYVIKLGETYRNVQRIELLGSTIPNTEYNVHSGNKWIDFNVCDTPNISTVKITNPGSNYAGTENVIFSSPQITGGTQANGTVIAAGQITGITMTPGPSGYTRSGGVSLTIDPPSGAGGGIQATAECEVGFEISASLTEGAYWVPTNLHSVFAVATTPPTPAENIFNNGNSSYAGNGMWPSLIREINDKLWAACFNMGSPSGYVNPAFPLPGQNPFPAPALVDIAAEPVQKAFPCLVFSGTRYNSTWKNRIGLQVPEQGTIDELIDAVALHDNSTQFLELLWRSGTHHKSNARRVLGYKYKDIHTDGWTTAIWDNSWDLDYIDITEKVPGLPSLPGTSRYDGGSGRPLLAGIINKSTAGEQFPLIKAPYDYNLHDWPQYVIMNLSPKIDRLDSNSSSINTKFATIFFEGLIPDFARNQQSNFSGASCTGEAIGAGAYMGRQAPRIRGSEIGKTVGFFDPPYAAIDQLDIKFTKYNGDLYNFHGRDHQLVFLITCLDVNAKNIY